MRIANIYNRINVSPLDLNSEDSKYHIQNEKMYRFHCFFSGSGFFRTEKEKFRIENYSFFMTFPKSNYSISYLSNSDLIVYYRIDFELDEDDTTKFADFLKSNFYMKEHNPGNIRLISYIYDIQRNFNINSQNIQIAATYLFKSFLYSLIDENKAEEVTPGIISYIDSACDFLKENIYNNISLDDICEQLNLTKSYFIRIFKNSMTLSPMKYFNFLKTQEAARLLIETKKTISEIAESLKFSSESHFSKTFKLYQTSSPGHYRRHYICSLETRQKKSDQELKEAYTLLQRIIDASPDLIFYKDINGILMGCNNAFSKIVGIPKEQIVGSSDFEIHPKNMAEFFIEQDQIVYQKNRPFKNEEWMTYPDGDKKRFEVYKAPFYDTEGNKIGLLGISRDITERIIAKKEIENRKEEERIANDQKTQFLYTIANEYLNSVTRIENYLIKSIPDSQNMKNTFFEKLLFECNYVNILTKDIISFLEYQSDEMNFQISAFNFLNFLTRIKTIINNNHLNTSSISFRIHSELPKIVFGDEARLLHVTIHLISTVILNSLDNDIDITVNYCDNKAIFEIVVMGVTFSETKRDSVINAIQSNDNTFFNKSVDLSTAIASKIIKAMNGELNIDFNEEKIIKYNLKLNLPSGVDHLNKYYSLNSK